MTETTLYKAEPFLADVSQNTRVLYENLQMAVLRLQNSFRIRFRTEIKNADEINLVILCSLVYSFYGVLLQPCWMKYEEFVAFCFICFIGTFFNCFLYMLCIQIRVDSLFNRIGKMWKCLIM